MAETGIDDLIWRLRDGQCICGQCNTMAEAADTITVLREQLARAEHEAWNKAIEAAANAVFTDDITHHAQLQAAIRSLSREG